MRKKKKNSWLKLILFLILGIVITGLTWFYERLYVPPCDSEICPTMMCDARGFPLMFHSQWCGGIIWVNLIIDITIWFIVVYVMFYILEWLNK